MQTVRGDTVTDVTDLAGITSGAPGDTAFAFDLHAPEGGFDAGATYRVKYQTCTIDGQIDPEDTTYSNEAQIEGWGDAGIGIGTATNRPWHQGITKSGSVLGGTDRNGKIGWTIVVPGSELVGKNGFNLTETLGTGHETRADTITGLKVVQQYGPSGDRRSDITADLDRTVNAETASGFDVDFAIKSSSDLVFQDSDWRYIITYNTYVTSSDLPEGGHVYSNAAEIDGTLTTGTATVPDRKYEKTGKLNNAAKTLDGVEHAAFTTLDWTVTIPGERLYDADGDALSTVTLEDVLGESHQVCVAGDPTAGVAERIGLNVQVQDQISGGGRTPSPATLTDLSTAAVESQTLTLTIDQPENQTFSRDYQYVISYTTCTSSGGIDARGTEYTNQIAGSGVEQTGKVTMNYTGSGTGTGVAKGSVAVSKALSGNGASLVPEGTMFTVHVKEIFGGATQLEYDLQVPANGDPVSGFNNRGNGWTFELSEPTFPNVPGVVFGAPKFSASSGVAVNEDGTVATAMITPQTNIAVELTNTAQLGQMTVTKQLEGPAAGEVDAEKVYNFYAVIQSPDGVADQDPRAFTVKAGATETLANLPIGSVVTITEVKPSNDDMFTWADPVISPNPVTITADNVATPAAVTVTNSVSRTVGTFALAKQVTGAQADNPAVPDAVTVTATWQQENETEPTSKQITLPTDGTPVAFGEQLLIGTQVTLSETPLVDGSSIAWGAPGWSGTGVVQGDDNTAVVTIGRNAEALVNLENHAATSTAGISLLKVLSGEAVADVPADAEFPVTATWIDADDEEQSVDLMINANEPTPLGVDLSAGTVVTITEGDRPSIDTVVWGSITISGEAVTDNGDGSAEIVVSDQQGDVTLVSVTNEATWAPGTFSLEKHVDGVLLDDAEVPETVDVIASWYEAGDDGLTERTETISVPTDGSAVDFGENLPAFTEVTLSEIVPDDTDRFTWNTPTWVGDEYLVVHEDGTATLTIQPAGAHELSLTNTAEATLGSVQLTKKLSGTGAIAVSQDTVFTVTAEWIDLLGEQQSREIEVSPAKSVVIDGVPFGTEVTLTEATAKNPNGARFTAAKWDSQDERVTLDSDNRTATVLVVGDPESPIALVLDNGYDEVKGLSVTGADFGGMITAAFVLLGLGGAALVLQRRRKQA